MILYQTGQEGFKAVPARQDSINWFTGRGTNQEWPLHYIPEGAARSPEEYYRGWDIGEGDPAMLGFSRGSGPITRMEPRQISEFHNELPVGVVPLVRPQLGKTSVQQRYQTIPTRGLHNREQPKKPLYRTIEDTNK